MTDSTHDRPAVTPSDTTLGNDAQAMLVPASAATAGLRPADHQLGILGALIDNQAWNRMVKIAETFSKSDLVPKHFQGKMANCIIALQCAIRMQVDPFMLMQNMYIVHGKPGIEAKFAIAMANAKRVFRGPIRFSLAGEGMKRQCTAVAIDRETGDRLQETVTMEMARREGWLDKEGSKWKSIPDLMLKYRSAMWLIRTTCPEVLMGMQTTDELLDVAVEPIPSAAFRKETRSPSDQLADILESRAAASTEVPISDSTAALSPDVLEPLTEAVPGPAAAAPQSGAAEVLNPMTDERHAEPVADLALQPEEKPTEFVARIKKLVLQAQGAAGLDLIATALRQSGSKVGPGHLEAIHRAISRRREELTAAAEEGSLLS